MNLKRIVLFVLVSLVFAAPTVVRSAHSNSAEILPITDAASSIETPQISIETDGLMVQWQIPKSEITEKEGVLFAELTGYEITGAPGHYLLPEQSVLVALPIDSTPVIDVTAVYAPPHALSYPFAVAPQPEGVGRNEFGEVIGGAFVPASLL